MPPKKASNGADGEASEGGKFVWEGPNDNKLLLLTQGRYVKPDEYEQLASAFPVSVTADHSTKKPKATPSKRAAGTEDRGEPETPTKKPRAPRKKESKSATPEDDEDMGDGVKKEELDEV